MQLQWEWYHDGMSPSDLDDILRQAGSHPLRLTLSSGDQLIVERPDLVAIGDYTLAFAADFEPGQRVGRRMRTVSIPNIALVERVTHRNGGRRRRK